MFASHQLLAMCYRLETSGASHSSSLSPAAQTNPAPLYSTPPDKKERAARVRPSVPERYKKKKSSLYQLFNKRRDAGAGAGAGGGERHKPPKTFFFLLSRIHTWYASSIHPFIPVGTYECRLRLFYWVFLWIHIPSFNLYHERERYHHRVVPQPTVPLHGALLGAASKTKTTNGHLI